MTGALYPVCSVLFLRDLLPFLQKSAETMAAHRAQLLLSLLPNALSFGFTEVDPELEPLKVNNNNKLCVTEMWLMNMS